MSRMSTQREMMWIKKLLSVEFIGKDILEYQISRSSATVDENSSYISVKFFIDGYVKRFPYKVRVPIEMRAYQTCAAPIVFLLHVVSGIVDELEIITADSSIINGDCICMDKVEYEIAKELQYK